jgi:LysR family transcriptional regulator, hydrogen peroxide-inducible genes activator
MPTITQLEYIIAVDTYRHFGTAAQKCYVTQPTLSMQIKKAEEELGIIIFDRSKQPVIPTDAGDAIVSQARIIIREMQRLDELISDYKNEVSGKLRLGIIPTLAPYLLPLFIGNLIRKYPKINIQVKELQTDEIADALKNDLLDVGIMVTPLKEHNIHELPLFYEEIKLYLHREHELNVKYKAQIPSDAVGNSNMWMLSEGNCFRNQMINLCSTTDLSPKSSFLPFEYEGGSLESLKRLVDREGGFTLLPELSVNDSDLSQIKSFSAPQPLREVSLCYVRNFAKIKILELLREEIINAVPSNMLNATRGQVVEWR